MKFARPDQESALETYKDILNDKTLKTIKIRQTSKPVE